MSVQFVDGLIFWNSYFADTVEISWYFCKVFINCDHLARKEWVALRNKAMGNTNHVPVMSSPFNP